MQLDPEVEASKFAETLGFFIEKIFTSIGFFLHDI